MRIIMTLLIIGLSLLTICSGIVVVQVLFRDPLAWQWGYWHPAFHLLFEVLGYLGSYLLFKRQKMPDVLTPKQRQQLKWWMLGGALIGAKLIPLIEHINTPLIGMILLTGKSLAGGLLGGIIGTELGKRKAGITVSSGDQLVWPLIVGSIIGRLGCASCAVVDQMVGKLIPETLLNHYPVLYGFGVNMLYARAYGKINNWDVVNFTQAGWYWNTPMLEIAGLVIIAGVLVVMGKVKRLTSGQLFYAFCLGYFTLRLAIDPLKHTHSVLTVVQAISLLGIVFSLWKLASIAKNSSTPTSTALN
jgi:phosphatidylglycerol---prolipoprotein diacylglyceryl transferase